MNGTTAPSSGTDSEWCPGDDGVVTLLAGASRRLTGAQDNLGGSGGKLGEVFRAARRRVPRPFVLGGPLKALLIAPGIPSFSGCSCGSWASSHHSEPIGIQILVATSLAPRSPGPEEALRGGEPQAKRLDHVPVGACTFDTRFETSACSSYLVALGINNHLPRCQTGRKY